MRKLTSYAALATALMIAGPSLAQTRATTAPQTGSTTDPASSMPSGSMSAAAGAPAASTGSGADTAARASASVSFGMPVKDNTGALIGDVSAVKGGIATIKMGADTFAVETSKLGVQDGTVTINATQAELKKMMPAKK